MERPPGAQLPADWAVFPNVAVANDIKNLQAFHLTQSHSRHSVVIWAERQNQLSWLWCHNRAFESPVG
jgi:hypothetical protein